MQREFVSCEIFYWPFSLSIVELVDPDELLQLQGKGNSVPGPT